VVYNAILRAIEAGQWKPGDRLPPETAIVRAMPFSLGTIQRALSKLAEDGVVERRRRQGTFVTGARAEPEALVHFHFRTADGGGLLPVYARALSVDVTEETGPWSGFLAGSRRFIRIQRAISVNFEFSIYSDLYLPYQRFRRLANNPERYLEGANFSHMLGTIFNAPTLRAIQRMRVCQVPAHAARHIGIAAGSAGMEWDIRAFSYRDKPLLMQRNWLPPTDYQLEIRGPVA
jgi:GntR family transcriptional regulator